MTMGTASTMASMVEALGVGLPGNAAIPAVDARRNVLARMAGRRIVEMVEEDLVLSKILTRAAFENAIRVNAAIGGSTNAVIHLLALPAAPASTSSSPTGMRWATTCRAWSICSRQAKYLMEDFYYAGGLPAVIRELDAVLNKDALTVNGRTLWENNCEAPRYDLDGTKRVIRPLGDPFKPHAGIAVLRGNLAPMAR